jgi:DNA-binding GntR family transcriptional regulator
MPNTRNRRKPRGRGTVGVVDQDPAAKRRFVRSTSADILANDPTLEVQLSVPRSIAEMLREKILSGELLGGARITENLISKNFGVGQPSVREALFILERQGLVKRVANLGTFVRELDVRDVSELYQIRKKLEGLAFELAAHRAGKEQIAELKSLVDNMKQAALKKGKRGFFESDLTFHRRVWELAGNQQLVQVLEQIVVPLFAFSFLRIERETADLTQSAIDHVSLVDALAKSPEQARQMSEKVVETFLQRYLSHVLNVSTATRLL